MKIAPANQRARRCDQKAAHMAPEGCQGTHMCARAPPETVLNGHIAQNGEICDLYTIYYAASENKYFQPFGMPWHVALQSFFSNSIPEPSQAMAGSEIGCPYDSIGPQTVSKMPT